MWDLLGKAAFVYFVSRLGWSSIKGLYGSFLASILGLNANIKKMGQWAVVTGATDGIGKAYAFEMARQGLNVVLISRNPFKLQNVSSEITSKYKVETKIIDVDFTSTNIYERIKKEISNLDIGVLINNVGIGYEYPEYFEALSDQFISDLISCNVISLTNMTKIVLPGMIEKRKGLIINLSSLSSLIAAPLLAVYGATKAYVLSFSESLEMEYRSKGIVIQCVAPGFVVSNMSRIRKASLMAPSPTAYVRSSIKTAGVEIATGGYYMHKLQIYAIEFVEKYLPGFIIPAITFSQLSTMRVKALKKKEK